MSSPYTVICHRCGKPTFVDLSRTISDQRCHKCRGFLQGVDVSIGDRLPGDLRRKLVVRVAGAGGREPEWQDQDAAVIPRRQRWPLFFRWLVWPGLITFLAIITRVIWTQATTHENSGNKPAAVQEETVQADIRTTAEWRDKAIDFAKRSLSMQTTGELLPLLYHPEVDDDAVRRYYATEEKLPLGTDLLDEYFVPPWPSAENMVVFNFTDTAGRPRALVVVEKKDGLKIDWPCLVGLGEMSLKEYLRTAPEDVIVMRARAHLADYYNNYFADNKKWLCVRLCDVTDENELYAYYDRDLPGSDRLLTALPNPSTDKVPRPDTPVIVVLKHPKANVSSNQTQLVTFLSASWYHEQGLKPLIEHARKLDETLRTITGETTPGPEKPPPSPPPGPDRPKAPSPP